MTKSVLAMTTINPDGEDAVRTYLETVEPLMEQAGAKLRMRYEVSQILSGADLPQFVSVIDYPDAEAIQMVFESPEYLALKPVLNEAFSKYEVCILG